MKHNFLLAMVGKKLLWTGSEDDVETGETTYLLFEDGLCFQIRDLDGEVLPVENAKEKLKMLCESKMQAAKGILALADILEPKENQDGEQSPAQQQPTSTTDGGSTGPADTTTAPAANTGGDASLVVETPGQAVDSQQNTTW